MLTQRFLERRAARLLAVASLALPMPATLCAQVAAPPPAASDTLLSSRALRADLEVLRLALETVHPGLHRYNTPAQIDALFADLSHRFATPQRPRDVFLALSKAMSRLQCGHTYLNPLNQSSAIADAVFRHTPRVPFHFRWIDRAMVVTQDASAERQFPVGTRVEAINGRATSDILARLMVYARADGSNPGKRIANLDVAPDSRWQAFDVYFPLVFPQPASAWEFRVRAPRSTASTMVRATPATSEQRLATYERLARAPRDGALPWALTVGDDGIAVLHMPTWVTYNSQWDWEGFVTRTFDSLAVLRVPALIIDLRGNEGGTSVGNAILSRLVTHDVVFEQFQRYTRYRTLPDSLRRHLDTWDRSFDDWGAAATPAVDRPGFFRLTRADDAKADTVVHARSPRYEGRVSVLVGAANSSATFEFALAARTLGVATIVGQPTGGNLRGINGGAFYFLRLPNSQLEVDLPIIGFYSRTTQPNRGLTPDVSIPEHWSDFTDGRDVVLERARRIATAQRRR